MKLKIVTIILSTLLLSACLYPNEQRTENQATNEEQLNRVQDAVHEYQELHNGLLPIQTRDQETPLLIKYPVNFNLLKEENLLGETPGNAFEQGGVYSYVIVDPEDEAIVKVADTRISQKLRSVNYEINMYRSKNGHPPYGESVGDGYFKLNEDRINMNVEPVVTSPYTNQELDIIMSRSGEAVVDYRPEVYQLLEREGIDSYEGDLRYLLLDYYPIVPAYSPKMILENDQIELTSEIDDD
ncbi:hypothetical protein [Alkalibacillus aidingensis]|uniref:hypothetical protein n=1 Tax=Alkalibacillus aidingensis TaxID=2747607 RepID=UPI0016606ED2|nr:hypothetical protein [Alkalibacillus aidingensis]